MIPGFLGIESTGSPFAEMWMGTHHGASSKIKGGNELIDLKDVSGDLPFLCKLIAVEKPLSIQAHPTKAQAVEGFEREEKLGLSLKNPKRCYKDVNSKPELLCALTPFTMMAGFKEPDMISRSLKALVSISPAINEIVSVLLKALDTGSLNLFFKTLFNFSVHEKEFLSSFILEKKPDIKDNGLSAKQWELMKDFATQYFGDPAVISPIYLNLVTLQPGQALFIPAGILHSYICGFGVELMTSSDNVLRGGLTPKYVDIGKLTDILYFVPFMPHTMSSASGTFSYHTPCKDFLLARISGNGCSAVFPENAVCIVSSGEVSADGVIFKKGESFFLPFDEKPYIFSGDYSLFAATSALKSEPVMTGVM